ncbi:MAG: cell division regulator GpsB [Desemzia incerta]|uniref:Cell cycle protein GpsB n=1 Tax=Desemzia incerta TaxID=82801 RepID=A0A1I5WRU0_9LACT|nr:MULTISPECIES: cell division regulator GpsB [Desemzia]MCI3029616.1 cell division regulator GpsB [Desemzia sp. C1]SFQ22146.1 DivIVA domain-containing protein [Desemzia incerta]
MADRTLTTKDILQKEFKTGMRGYNPAEVDEYLDEVIRDYESYNKEISQLKAENERLHSKVDELTKQVSLQKPSQSGQSANTVTNFDILKRLSNLERHVFGSKLDADHSNDFE